MYSVRVWGGYVQVRASALGAIRSTGAGVLRGCEQPEVVLGTKLMSSAGAVKALNCRASSPASTNNENIKR